MNTKLLAIPAALLFPALASAQVTYGTDDGAGMDNFVLEIGTGMSTGPEWTDFSAWGIADDESTLTYYIGSGAQLGTHRFGMAGGAAVLLGTVTAAGSGGTTTVLTGHAYENGILYGNKNITVKGLYSIDLVTLEATLVMAYSSTALDLGGLDVDPATGLLFGSNDGSSYTDPFGNSGLGVVIVDPVAQTEVLAYPYPAGETDIDGLAFDPTGMGSVYLIEDEPAPLHRFDIGTMAYDPAPAMNSILASEVFSAGTYTGQGGSGLGTNYCTAAVNSTGNAGVMSAMGSATAADNSVTLRASSLPTNQFGIFLTSMTQAFIPGTNGTSNGNLCLGGSIGRYSASGQILSTGGTGEIALAIDLTAIPQGGSNYAVMAGQAVNFQAWHRDGVGLGSNFTDGYEITFY